MDKVVAEYKKRRQERLDARRGVSREPRYDSVEEFRKRRQVRMDIRGEFNENDHPRGKDGKFVKGAGGGEAASNGGKNHIGPKVEAEKPVKISKPPIKKSNPDNDRKKQECDGTGYKGKPGEVKTGAKKNLAPKSEISKKINTADAVAETELYKKTGGKKGLEKNSLSGQKVHDEIVQKLFADKVPYDGQATMTMSGGGPASGKSFVSKAAKKKFGEDTVMVVDPDGVKAMLPGYADMAVDGDKAAGFYHEESSALAKRIYQYALDNNINVVYDGTGDGSIGSVAKKINTARDAGYKVTGEYVTVNVEGPNGALVRNKGRYENAVTDWNNGRQDMDPPRLVGEEHVREIHQKVSDILPDVANMFDEFTLTDNNVPQGAERPLIATCKRGGEINVVKGMEDKVQDCLNKGRRGGKVVNGKVVFPDMKK